MMSVGDIYCVKVFQSYLAQQVLNVYFYRQVGGVAITDGTPALHEAFDINVLVEQVGTANTRLQVTNLEVFNPAIPTQLFDGVPINNQGLRAAIDDVVSPSFMSFAYASNRGGAGSRRSFKRFCGLTDTDFFNNVLDGVFLAIPAVVNLGAVLGQTILDVALSASFTPVQVKHPVPLGFPVVENFILTSWQTPYLTSQVSRRLT